MEQLRSCRFYCSVPNLDASHVDVQMVCKNLLTTYFGPFIGRERQTQLHDLQSWDMQSETLVKQ